MQNKITSQTFLEISLLGGFQVKIDDVPIDEKCWGRRSAKLLVKLLALKPLHAVHREQIMDLLWTEHTPETAGNNLNKAIYKARRTLEPDLVKGSDSRFILTQNKQIILDSPGSLRIDLDEFERLANYAIRNDDLEAGQKAIELYRGDLLTEDIYEDWIYTRRESIRILFRKTGTKTAELYATKGNHSKSIEILKKLIAEDATDEHIHRLLMRFYVETDSKYQALKQFEFCRTALKVLGVESDVQTIALEKSIKCGEILPVKNISESASAKSAVSTPHVTPLTFQTGIIKSAKFSADDKMVVMSANWDGEGFQIYTMSLETNDIHRLGLKEADVFSISSAGEMAVGLKPIWGFVLKNPATLAILPSTGGLPVKLLEDVQYADWHPVGNAHTSLNDQYSLAVVREKDGKNCLEYPIGNVIFETGGWISHPRFSANGKKIAFIEHPFLGDDRGFVVCLDLENKSNGEKRILTENRTSIMGLAWLKDEICFTASREGNARTINAVNLKGEERRIYRGLGMLTLCDFSKSGAALVTNDKLRVQVIARHANVGVERNLSWHDCTLPRDLTDDGETLLFEEAGMSGGSEFSAYVRKLDGSSTRKIGDGSALALSPDGKYVLLRFHRPHSHLALMPIGGGEMKPLETDPANLLDYEVFAAFFPDGKRIIFAANEADGEKRIYTQKTDGGKPVRFAPLEEGVQMLSPHTISPDGKSVILTDSENRLTLYQTTGGTSSPLKNLEKNYFLVRWAGDGENLFVWRRGELPAIVYKYNLANATKKKWLELMPKDITDVSQMLSIKLTPDGKTYAYSFLRESSDLYLMEDF